MATKIDMLKWKLYLKKRKLLIRWGLSRGLVRSYDKDVIEKLRNVYYGGISGSVMLLCPEMCDGHCYDRALLLCLGFDEEDDFQMVDAEIDGLRLCPKYIDNKFDNYAVHCFVERTMKDGSTWVYDISDGIVYDKRIYYMMDNPKIIKINKKQDIFNYCEYQDIKNADIERDKYSAPLILPTYEYFASKKSLYSEVLQEEIRLYKEAIGYDMVVAEIDSDMRRLGIRK